MKRRCVFVVFCLVLSALAAFGQTDRGTITGAVSDATQPGRGVGGGG